jgi:hypothetical protein
MIRATLRNTKMATWAVYARTRSDRPPEVLGTCFCIDSRGLFLTARHVVVDKIGDPLRIEGLLQPTPVQDRASGPLRVAEGISIVELWAASDTALLRADLSRNAPKSWFADGFSSVQVAGSVPDDGAPVYSYGYPLPREVYTVDYGIAAIAWPALSPRLVSATLAGQEYVVGGDPGQARQDLLLIDKAFDYGHSGAALMSVDTGEVLGVAIEFEPTTIDQGDGRGLWIPSNFGVVSSMSNVSEDLASFLRS